MKRWLKCDFHNHTSLDLLELKENTPVSYTPQTLIDKAVKLGYDAIALTHHDALLLPKEVETYAIKKGILLIPGMEKTIKKKHVVILNASKEILNKIHTFSDLGKLPNSAVTIAAHPYYILGSCLMEDLIPNIKYFDAIEWNSWYSIFFNFPNRKAQKIAKQYNKPMVGDSDTHELFQFGTTSTLVYAEKNKDSILQAIKNGKTKLHTKPMSIVNFSKVIIFRIVNHKIMKLFKKCKLVK